MKSCLKLFLFFVLLLPMVAMAQLSPLPVDADTIGLWNFNDDIDETVIDLAPSPLNGTAFTTERLPVPGIDSSFGQARRFSSQSSFVDLGVTQGSKLDFTGWNEFTIEALIHLDQAANSDHIIFSSENVRLMIVNNQLAGYIRQPGGLFGVVSNRTLSLNTSYRVALLYKSQRLTLIINDKTDSTVLLEDEVQAPQFSNSRSYIGGDIFARYFPGYIDDVRIRNVADFDMTPPVVTLIEPTSFQVSSLKPIFNISFSDDDIGIDEGSIEIYLNGISQVGISRNASGISGVLDDEMSSTLMNEVKVIVADLNGNKTTKSFFFTYSNVFSRQEYATDVYTLALWHMNDFSPGHIKDDSGNGRNGYGNPNYIQISDGVFDQGRYFTHDGVINFDSIRFSELKFSFEGWFRPNANSVEEEVLFYNGQVKIVRWNGGYIRVTLFTTKGEKTYHSSSSLLPLNELHHFAVTWDGTKENQNLFFYMDGNFQGAINAISDCDFDPIPKLGQIGGRYVGLMDEVRFSSTIRTGFNIPVFDNQVISFLNLKNGTSVNEEFPVFHATLNSSSEINVATLKIKLNGQLEPSSPNLVVTSTGIDGTFSRPLQIGENELEISFLDNLGNERKKTQYFFYIKKNGGAEYQAGNDTAGLWHFNESSQYEFRDSSGNENHFSTTYLTGDSPGVIGNAAKGAISFNEKMPLNCKSFTIESFVKVNQIYEGFIPVYTLGNANFSHALQVNPLNGNVLIHINNSPELNIEVPQALPVDNGFHHVAIVYDSARSFSQLLLIVNGEVKKAVDYHNLCNFVGANNFSVGYGMHLAFDEMRVSKSAHYSFNLQNAVSDRPSLVSASVTDGDTVSEKNITFDFVVSDSDAINESKTKILLNGVEQSVVVEQKMRPGLSSHFSADLELINGKNVLMILAEDVYGNLQVINHSIYYFKSLPVNEYVMDDKTLFLFHFNETEGDFFDSSASGQTLSTSYWTSSEGVFSGGARNSANYNSNTFPTFDGSNGWTFESWVKSVPLTYFQLIQSNDLTISVGASGPAVQLNGIAYSKEGSYILDNLWHHYSVVVDPNHPYSNMYLLVDGKVHYSVNTKEQLIINYIGAYLGYSMNTALADEMRFSTTPRYEFVSSLE